MKELIKKTTQEFKLDIQALSELETPEELKEYIHKTYTWEQAPFLGTKNLRTLAFYEAFLAGVEAVYKEFGRGDELQVSALKYLQKLEEVPGVF